MQTQNNLLNRELGAFATIVAVDNMRNIYEGQSDRAIFKQLLLMDVLKIIDTKTNNNFLALEDIRQYFRMDYYLSSRFYSKLYSGKWSFTTWNDRWYRAMQSINNGTDLTVKKIGGKLYAFAGAGTTNWTANYTGHSK